MISSFMKAVLDPNFMFVLLVSVAVFATFFGLVTVCDLPDELLQAYVAGIMKSLVP